MIAGVLYPIDVVIFAVDFRDNVVPIIESLRLGEFRLQYFKEFKTSPSGVYFNGEGVAFLGNRDEQIGRHRLPGFIPRLFGRFPRAI